MRFKCWAVIVEDDDGAIHIYAAYGYKPNAVRECNRMNKKYVGFNYRVIRMKEVK